MRAKLDWSFFAYFDLTEWTGSQNFIQKCVPFFLATLLRRKRVRSVNKYSDLLFLPLNLRVCVYLSDLNKNVCMSELYNTSIKQLRKIWDETTRAFFVGSLITNLYGHFCWKKVVGRLEPCRWKENNDTKLSRRWRQVASY